MSRFGDTVGRDDDHARLGCSARNDGEDVEEARRTEVWRILDETFRDLE